MPDNSYVVQRTRHLAGSGESGIFWATGIAGALFLIALVFAGCEFWLVQQSLTAQGRYGALLMAQRDRLMRLVNEESGIRGFVATGDTRFLDTYYDSQTQIADLNDELGSADDSSADSSFGETMRAQHRVETYFTGELSLVRAGKAAVARQRLEDGKEIFDRLRRAEHARCGTRAPV